MRGASFLLGAVFGLLLGALTVWDALEGAPVIVPEPAPVAQGTDKVRAN